MSIGVEEIVIAHEAIRLPNLAVQKLKRFAFSGPVGFEKVVQAVKKLSASTDGLKALTQIAKQTSNHVYQNNQSNIQFLRSSAKRGGYSKAKGAGLASISKGMSTEAARGYVNRYVMGIEK